MASRTSLFSSLCPSSDGATVPGRHVALPRAVSPFIPHRHTMQDQHRLTLMPRDHLRQGAPRPTACHRGSLIAVVYQLLHEPAKNVGVVTLAATLNVAAAVALASDVFRDPFAWTGRSGTKCGGWEAVAAGSRSVMVGSGCRGSPRAWCRGPVRQRDCRVPDFIWRILVLINGGDLVDSLIHTQCSRVMHPKG